MCGADIQQEVYYDAQASAIVRLAVLNMVCLGILGY